MKYLLDTHVIIWALINDERINKKTHDLLIDPKNEIMYSTVSSWEIALKHSKKIILD